MKILGNDEIHDRDTCGDEISCYDISKVLQTSANRERIQMDKVGVKIIMALAGESTI